MIDEEHKQLFQYADEAYELLHNDMIPDKFDTIHDVLMNLRNYTVKHFSDEEEYIRVSMTIYSLKLIRVFEGDCSNERKKIGNILKTALVLFLAVWLLL